MIVRSDSSNDKGFLEMLKNFKVPVGINDEEKAKIQAFFAQRDAKNNSNIFKRIYSKLAFWSEDKMFNSMGDHSSAIYLMAPDNKFLAFYPLDFTEDELAKQITEDISYDLG